MLAKLWARVGTWVGGIVAILSVVAAAVLYGMRRGAAHQIERDAITNAKAATQAAHEAQATLGDANAAAQAVQQQAAAQPAPDTVKRDDFNTTF